MLFNDAFASLLALIPFSGAASLKHKRTTEDVTFFGYGGDANGAPVFFADGLAYLGAHGMPSGAIVGTNVTFTVNTDDTTTPWTIAANSSTYAFNETLELYIVPTDGNFVQVGFASANSTSLPDGAVTTGFGFFGTIVAYVESQSNYEMLFWANATTDDGVYALYWNAGSSDVPSGAFPVTIKTTAPVSSSSLGDKLV